MSYRINYGHPSDKRYPAASGQGRLPSMICAAFLLFLLLTNTFWPSGRALLKDLFIPGNPETTANAFSGLMEDIREGEELSEALTVFCREILFDEEIPD